MGDRAGVPVRESWLVLAACIAASLAWYAPFLPAFFQWDDIPLFAMSTHRMGISAWQCLCPTPNGFWRPLNLLACHMIERLCGLSPVAFHGIAAAIHGCVAWAAWRCAREVLGWKPRWSVLAAAACVVHPAASACCLSFANSCDSLLALLALVAWILLERSARTGNSRPATAAACIALAAFGTKETAVVLPFALAVLVLAARRPARREVAMFGGLALVGLCVASALFAIMARSPNSYLAAGRLEISATGFPRNACDYLASAAVPYLHLLEWPLLRPDIGHGVLWGTRIAVAIAVAVLVIVSIRRTELRTAASLFAAALLFVLPACCVTGPPHARYLYPALPWAVLGFVELLRLLSMRRPMVSAAIGAAWLALLLPGVPLSPSMTEHRSAALRMERFVDAARIESASWPEGTSVRVIGHPHPGADVVRWPYCQLVFFVWLERRDIVVVLDHAAPADVSYWFDGVHLRRSGPEGGQSSPMAAGMRRVPPPRLP